LNTRVDGIEVLDNLARIIPYVSFDQIRSQLPSIDSADGSRHEGTRTLVGPVQISRLTATRRELINNPASAMEI